MYCQFCGSEKHTLSNCPKTADGQANRRNMYCVYCGARDHAVNACPKTAGGYADRKWNPGDIEDDYFQD